MTKSRERRRCGWCGREFVLSPGRGRPREYCRASCRQRAYELRRRQQTGTLAPDEVPISWELFERLRDGLYVLTAALEDVERDVAEDGDFAAAYQHLFSSASPLRSVELEVSRLAGRDSDDVAPEARNS